MIDLDQMSELESLINRYGAQTVRDAIDEIEARKQADKIAMRRASRRQ